MNMPCWRFHIEAGLALALRTHHPSVECAGQRHQAQHPDQGRGIEPRVPRSMRAIVVAQHADHIEAQRMRDIGSTSLVGTRLRAGQRDCQRRVIDDIARPIARLWHMQCQLWQIAVGHAVSCSRTVSADSIK